MVVGGSPVTAYQHSEIIDLSGQDLECMHVDEHPADYGAFGTFINGTPKVCGGIVVTDGLPYDYLDECYTYMSGVGY